MKTHNNEHISTALLLAAGTGSRLYPLTKSKPKCMTIVNGRSILERMISSLIYHNFKRLIIVTGHLEDYIRNFLGNQVGSMKIEYIFSPPYKTTNNIYSLWMARKAIKEPILLLESDLVYDKYLLDYMLYPDRIAIAKMQPWMNGTCVTIHQSGGVKAFIAGNKESCCNEDKYKTVNIYSFSLNSWKKIVKRLDKKISDGKVNDYYETVFADMVAEKSLSLKDVLFDNKLWYEIDTLKDLAEAEKIFPLHINKFNKAVAQPKPNGCQQLINTAISPEKTILALDVTT